MEETTQTQECKQEVDRSPGLPVLLVMQGAGCVNRYRERVWELGGAVPGTQIRQALGDSCE